MNILLLGGDRRPHENEPSRTDAVIIAHIDPARKRVALLSLPRDLMVEIPGYGATRINAANVWGKRSMASRAAAWRSHAKTVDVPATGIPIDYMIYVDLQGFLSGLI